MKRIRVGGVPEHFNEVWQMALEKKSFERVEIDLEWNSIREGTGAMIDKLKSKDLDLIVALTEGLISQICRDNSSNLRLIGTYVQSPLLWSISVKNESSFQTIEDLKGKTFGISRYQSGSHLMSLVLANQFGWNSTDLTFSIQNNFDNLRLALENEEIDVFLWEYFMQKPFYDQKRYRHLSNLLTPWSCFLLASRKDFIDENLFHLKNLFQILRFECEEFHRNEKNLSIERISSKYHLNSIDAEKWFKQVEIIGENFISKSTIETTIEALRNAQIIDKDFHRIDFNEFVDQRLTKILVDIKSMRLYNKPELLIALRNNLRCHHLHKGYLSYRDLLEFDQNHYFGTQVLDLAANLLKLNDKKGNSSDWSIQIGSNLGGCSRYLAGKYSCRILAIELQNDLSSFADELTRRCQLEDLIEHLSGNYLHLCQHLQENFYASIFSWLTILHFNENERKHLFSQSFRLIRSEGFFYLEDFIRIDQLTNEEQQILENDVFCQYLPTKDEYLHQLIECGFQIISFDDLTSQWKDFTRQRVEQFEKNRIQLISIHGEDLFSRLKFFYRSIQTLFQSNHVGGIRILAQKPSS